MSANNHIPKVKELKASEYTYELPADRIASYPLAERDASSLLVYKDKKIVDAAFQEMASFLDPDTLMVFNDTRVVQARLEFFKETGARIEIFCLHPEGVHRDVGLVLSGGPPSRWFCLVGNAKKWKAGPLVIQHPDGNFRLEAHKVKASGDGYLVDFSWHPAHLSFAEVLELTGKTPLPPYITRPAEQKDKITYQTIFASNDGSVAAPTAGLHFTDRVMKSLQAKGIQQGYLTLHVGAGTFKPVTSEHIGEHHMHGEQFSVTKAFIQKLAQHQQPIVPVGTTCMRTLESLYWIGASMVAGIDLEVGDGLYLPQWAPYAFPGGKPDRPSAMRALLDYLERCDKVSLQGETALIIVPGYRFAMTDALVTNFHQPGSTLLLLVAAFTGKAWKQIYHHALRQSYRFLSYGDACLLFP